MSAEYTVHFDNSTSTTVMAYDIDQAYERGDEIAEERGTRVHMVTRNVPIDSFRSGLSGCGDHVFYVD